MRFAPAALPPSINTRPRRRVLIVTPNFAPVSAVDYQRIRQVLPHLEPWGWEAQILAVDPQHIEHAQDPCLSATLPPALPIHRVAALPQRWTRPLGLGNLGWRSLLFLAAEGDRLLAQQPFDLVFFSTTVFPSLLLGPRWKRKFGLPYVVDFQDPWRVDRAQQQQRAVRRPGGRWKYAIDKTLARYLEPQVVQQAAQIIAVSQDYLAQLQRRYPQLQPAQCHTITFGAPEQDFDHLAKLSIQQTIFDPQDGKQHWVYVGRGGDDLKPAVQQLFHGIARDRQDNPQGWQRIQIHFIGTSYAPAELAQPSFLGLAADFGLADIVSEFPQRVPYFEALQLLVQSDAILLLGSRDSSYSPSKVYPCLLAEKPILALLSGESAVKPLLAQAQPGAVIEQRSIGAPSEAVDASLRRRLHQLLQGEAPLDQVQLQAALEPYRPQVLTARLVDVFERSLLDSQRPDSHPTLSPRNWS